ncbi:MAG: DNA-3-methyladenine glycosylase 2 [Clostridia bacterium]|nr:DNA-3-methyladenine glycosylase 2 [Clostridia bacterium]
MIYEVKDNKIIVKDTTQFNPKHILECGQVFRYGINAEGNYFVYSKNHYAIIIKNAKTYEIECDNVDYFINYFDLNRDYNQIKTILKKNKVLSPMIDYGYGIRILNGDAEEMIYSYIISQNNNIKRIQKIIEKLCEVGEKQNNFNAFPTTKKLSSLPLTFFQSLGAGYRDKFLKNTADALLNVNLENIKQLSTDEIYNFLISLNGVGPKVASCILLFGFGKTNKFPVDTWIEQVYYNHFSTEKRTRPAIQKYFEDEFGEYSGIAQQYLFYYEREQKNEG